VQADLDDILAWRENVKVRVDRASRDGDVPIKEKNFGRVGPVQGELVCGCQRGGSLPEALAL
jgi:hypothetical protein